MAVVLSCGVIVLLFVLCRLRGRLLLTGCFPALVVRLLVPPLSLVGRVAGLLTPGPPVCALHFLPVALDFVFGDPNLTPPPWRGQKVLWARAPSYRGPLLIRGHQLDGTWWVGFEYGQPLQELQIRPLPAVASVKRYWGW